MPRSRQHKVTTRAEDRYIINVVANNSFMTGPETHRRLYAASGRGALPVSIQTVWKHIHSGGFRSIVPAEKPALIQCHKHARIAFSGAYAGWNICRLEQWTMEKGYVLGRVQVLSEAS